jgi:hypothetical protein
MDGFGRSLARAAFGAGALLFAAANASAAMVDWGKGGWPVHEKHKHPVKNVVVFYANDWRWGRTDDPQWRREHGLRGCLRGNKLIWIEPSYLHPFSPPADGCPYQNR